MLIYAVGCKKSAVNYLEVKKIQFIFSRGKFLLNILFSLFFYNFRYFPFTTLRDISMKQYCVQLWAQHETVLCSAVGTRYQHWTILYSAVGTTSYRNWTILCSAVGKTILCSAAGKTIYQHWTILCSALNTTRYQNGTIISSAVGTTIY